LQALGEEPERVALGLQARQLVGLELVQVRQDLSHGEHLAGEGFEKVPLGHWHMLPLRIAGDTQDKQLELVPAEHVEQLSLHLLQFASSGFLKKPDAH
jgi:hypothetical protein